mgnify:CR=1 FL=1
MIMKYKIKDLPQKKVKTNEKTVMLENFLLANDNTKIKVVKESSFNPSFDISYRLEIYEDNTLNVKKEISTETFMELCRKCNKNCLTKIIYNTEINNRNVEINIFKDKKGNILKKIAKTENKKLNNKDWIEKGVSAQELENDFDVWKQMSYN